MIVEIFDALVDELLGFYNDFKLMHRASMKRNRLEMIDSFLVRADKWG